nr:MAG TPA: YvrJ protein family protein [Caudoviricetes sp.]
MDANIISQIISNIGFPCAMCLLMYYHMNRQTEAHAEEISKLTSVINDNTVATKQLVTLLSKNDG